ncbi:hypothetical protein JHK87_033346 [Glycine soja]|nr:hypothetical protein JHK87_033346 [Glycine soja]
MYMLKEKIIFLLLHTYAFLNRLQHNRYAITQKPLRCHLICVSRKLKKFQQQKIQNGGFVVVKHDEWGRFPLCHSEEGMEKVKGKWR